MNSHWLSIFSDYKKQLSAAPEGERSSYPLLCLSFLRKGLTFISCADDLSTYRSWGYFAVTFGIQKNAICEIQYFNRPADEEFAAQLARVEGLRNDGGTKLEVLVLKNAESWPRELLDHWASYLEQLQGEIAIFLQGTAIQEMTQKSPKLLELCSLHIFLGADFDKESFLYLLQPRDHSPAPPKKEYEQFSEQMTSKLAELPVLFPEQLAEHLFSLPFYLTEQNRLVEQAKAYQLASDEALILVPSRTKWQQIAELLRCSAKWNHIYYAGTTRAEHTSGDSEIGSQDALYVQQADTLLLPHCLALNPEQLIEISKLQVWEQREIDPRLERLRESYERLEQELYMSLEAPSSQLASGGLNKDSGRGVDNAPPKPLANAGTQGLNVKGLAAQRFEPAINARFDRIILQQLLEIEVNDRGMISIYDANEVGSGPYSCNRISPTEFLLPNPYAGYQVHKYQLVGPLEPIIQAQQRPEATAQSQAESMPQSPSSENFENLSGPRISFYHILGGSQKSKEEISELLQTLLSDLDKVTEGLPSSEVYLSNIFLSTDDSPAQGAKESSSQNDALKLRSRISSSLEWLRQNS